ncbi:MAG: peptidyl-prolyl cis-trans isomerase [Bacteroidetes bacterium]|nr:peptidyl-prolyl cis-trans isomerase [Bacteroidota bacterium]MBU1422820.1 peptidyl-prolyl cis-trans isomerase [Bacteroidota bacterium]
MPKILVVFIGFLIIFNSCKKDETQKPFIARVGDSYLTVEDAEKYVEGNLDTANIRLKSFINKWIESEILYQEAAKKGIPESEEIKQQLNEVKKQLAVQLFIDKEVYADSNEISDSELYLYYELHSEEFTLREDAVKLNLAAFKDRQSANNLRTSVLKGKSWADAMNKLQTNEDERKNLQMYVSAHLFTQLTLYPTELWKVVQNLSKDDVSFPVKIGDVFYIVQVIEKFMKGSVADLDLIKDEVRTRLTIEKRKSKYANLLADLQKKYLIQINIDSLQPK